MSKDILVSKRSEMADSLTGYTNDMYAFSEDLTIHTRFMKILVKLGLIPVRLAQVINSDFGQKRFEQMRNGEI